MFKTNAIVFASVNGWCLRYEMSWRARNTENNSVARQKKSVPGAVSVARDPVEEPRLRHAAVDLTERDANVSRLTLDLVERHVRTVLKLVILRE